MNSRSRHISPRQHSALQLLLLASVRLWSGVAACSAQTISKMRPVKTAMT